MTERAQYPKKLYKPGGQIVRVLSAEEHAEYADWSEDHRVRLLPEQDEISELAESASEESEESAPRQRGRSRRRGAS